MKTVKTTRRRIRRWENRAKTFHGLKPANAWAGHPPLIDGNFAVAACPKAEFPFGRDAVAIETLPGENLEDAQRRARDEFDVMSLMLSQLRWLVSIRL